MTREEMAMAFRDRADAGRRLADRLTRWGLGDDVVVLGLPRAWCPVGSLLFRPLAPGPLSRLCSLRVPLAGPNSSTRTTAHGGFTWVCDFAAAKIPLTVNRRFVSQNGRVIPVCAHQLGRDGRRRTSR